MSDSEGESRTTAVGRMRHPHGKSGVDAGSPAAGGVESGSESDESKESSEISSSSSDSRRNSHQGQKRPHPQDSDSDQGSESDDSSSETDSSSAETDDSEDEAPAHSMASPRGHSHSGHADKKLKGSNPGEDSRLRMKHLSQRDRDEQEDYFLCYAGHASDNDLVRCFCCGELGHIREGCPERTCKHCGVKDQHASYTCPSGRKCARCRQRGHDTTTCTNPTRPPAVVPCDVCGEKGHVEEECIKLWWTSKQEVPMPKVHRMYKACYNCGDDGLHAHFGDDCPYLERDQITGQIDTWSAKHANLYIDPNVVPDEEKDDYTSISAEDEDEGMGGEDGSEAGEVKESPPPPPARNWQLAMLDDTRD